MKIYTAKTNSRIAQITAKLAVPYARGLDKKCFIFCEDKNTLSLESMVAGSTEDLITATEESADSLSIKDSVLKEVGGSFNIQVTSFARYISSRKDGKNMLSKIGSALTVYRIMDDMESQLSRLKLGGNASFASCVYELIAQLKSAKASPEDLERVTEQVGGAFSTKLKDIAKIYAEYEKQVKESGMLDGNTFYSLIPQIVASDESIRGAKVIFSGFSSVTKQIVDVFKAFSATCDCDFVLLEGEGEFYTNEVSSIVQSVFKDAVKVEDDFELSPLHTAIEKSLFSAGNFPKVPQYSDKVHIFECKNVYEEAERVALEIRREVIENGARYKDFAIACSNPAEYGEIFKDKFDDFELPLYIDQKTTMEKHPIIRFIVAVLTVVAGGYDVPSILSLARERLMCSQEELNAFERYIKKYAISRRTIKKPFEIIELDDCVCEKVRSDIIAICSSYKETMSAEDFVEATKKVLDDADILEKATLLSDELSEIGLEMLASINEQVIKKLDGVLEEVKMAVKGRTMKITDFRAMLLSASASSEVSILPLYNDMIYMGDFKSVKQRESKVLFAVGLTADVPSAKQDIALLTDRDLVKMEGYNCFVEPKIEVVNRRERENVGVCLMSFNDRLYLSYPLCDATGERCNKSEIIDDFLKIFDVKPKRADARGSVYDYMSIEQGKQNFALFVDNYKNRQNDEIEDASSFFVAMKELGREDELGCVLIEEGNGFSEPVTKHFSASVIESYFSCPYMCFAQNNLGLKEDETGEVQPLEMGNLLHSVLELFVSRRDEIHSEEDARKMGAMLYEEITKDRIYARYLNKPDYIHIFNLVKKEAENRCVKIYREYQNSAFVPLGEEVPFGQDDSEFKPIPLSTPYGTQYVRGRVDRIDKYNEYIRVIDYKTGSPEEKIKEERLYSGTNIQLYLYPNAFLNKDTKLGGVYYYKVDESYLNEGESAQCYMGKTLFSEDVANAMDSTIKEKGKSDDFGIGYKVTKKSGATLSKTKNFLEEGELKDYVKYAIKVAENGATELLEGHITPSPYDKSCEYCKFNGMCGFNSEVDNTTRKLENVTASTISDALKENEDE